MEQAKRRLRSEMVALVSITGIVGLIGVGILYWQYPHREDARREIRAFCDPIAMGDRREAVMSRFEAGRYRTLQIWPYPSGSGQWLMVSTPMELTAHNWYCIIGIEDDRVVAVGYRDEDNHAWTQGGPPRGAPPDRTSEMKHPAL